MVTQATAQTTGSATGRNRSNDKTHAQVHTIDGASQFDSKVVSETVKIIVNSGKQDSGRLNDIVDCIRSCKDWSTALTMLVFSERKACEKEGVKTLAGLAAKYDVGQLSYTVTKSQILKAADENTDKLRKSWKDWAEFDHKANGKDLRKQPDGFLNIFSARYSPQGAGKTVTRSGTLFMRDVRECLKAGSDLLVGTRAAETAARNAAQTQAGTGTPAAPAEGQTAQGMRSGGGSELAPAMRPKETETYAAIGRLIVRFQDVLSDDSVNEVLNMCLVTLSQRAEAARIAKEVQTPEKSRQRPNKAAAAAARKAKEATLPNLDDGAGAELTEQDKKNIAAVA